MSIEAVLSGDARWCVVHGDLREVLPTMAADAVHVVVTDPPYSEAVHKSVRSAKRTEMPDVAEYACCTRRTVDLGFEHLSAPLRRQCAREFARIAARWTLAFSDIESCHLWRHSLEAAGLKYHRTGAWDRVGGAPQFTGTEPANAIETITIAHRPGKRHWNGGGHRAFYTHPIVCNRGGQEGSRVHPSQKPLGLMVDLVQDFTDPDDIVLDPFCGSGTTGVACLQLGRRFIGIELDTKHAETARKRLEAVTTTLPGASYRRERQQELLK
jgi:site-specific DNA-methyltransferase (adenine-specific)